MTIVLDLDLLLDDNKDEIELELDCDEWDSELDMH